MLRVDETEPRLLMRIVQRLHDEARKGRDSWQLIEPVMAAAREQRLYVLLDRRRRMEGFLALSTQLEPEGPSELEVVVFRALRPGAGERMLQWLGPTAAACQFGSVGATFVDDVDVWKRAGFQRRAHFGVVCRLNRP